MISGILPCGGLPAAQMANVTVEFNRKTQTFKLQGMNALGHPYWQKVTSLTMAELMQVSKLLSDGVFQFMIDNNIAIKKEVATFHHTHVAEFFGLREPEPVVSSAASSAKIESPMPEPDLYQKYVDYGIVGIEDFKRRIKEESQIAKASDS